MSYKLTPMNRKRAQWARLALVTFGVQTGQEIKRGADSDERDMVGDLLADLMHYCAQRKGLDFEERLERGREHFEAERTGNED